MLYLHLRLPHHGFHADPETQVCYRTLAFMGFPNYRVGDDGSVWAFHMYSRTHPNNWKKLKTKRNDPRNPKTHMRVVLVFRKERTYFLVHRLILLAFVGSRKTGEEACHSNDIGHDNRLQNLRWDTKAANTRDRFKNGTIRYGDDNPMTKISRSEIEWLVSEFKKPHGLSARAFARLHAPNFNVSDQTIRSLVAGGGRKPPKTN